MASTLSVTVPPDQGDEVLATLLTQYQTRAEALRAATLAYLEDRESLGPVAEHRDELTELEALIDLAGWSFGARIAPVELVGPPALVRETVYLALASAAEAVVRDVERYERGGVELGQLDARVRAATVLFGVFTSLEGG